MKTGKTKIITKRHKHNRINMHQRKIISDYLLSVNDQYEMPFQKSRKLQAH